MTLDINVKCQLSLASLLIPFPVANVTIQQTIHKLLLTGYWWSMHRLVVKLLKQYICFQNTEKYHYCPLKETEKHNLQCCWNETNEPARGDKHIVSGIGTHEAVGDAWWCQLCRGATHSILGRHVPQHDAVHLPLTIQTVNNTRLTGNNYCETMTCVSK